MDSQELCIFVYLIFCYVCFDVCITVIHMIHLPKSLSQIQAYKKGKGKVYIYEFTITPCFCVSVLFIKCIFVYYFYLYHSLTGNVKLSTI